MPLVPILALTTAAIAGSAVKNRARRRTDELIRAEPSVPRTPIAVPEVRLDQPGPAEPPPEPIQGKPVFDTWYGPARITIESAPISDELPHGGYAWHVRTNVAAIDEGLEPIGRRDQVQGLKWDAVVAAQDFVESIYPHFEREVMVSDATGHGSRVELIVWPLGEHDLEGGTQYRSYMITYPRGGITNPLPGRTYLLDLRQRPDQAQPSGRVAGYRVYSRSSWPSTALARSGWAYDAGHHELLGGASLWGDMATALSRDF